MDKIDLVKWAVSSSKTRLEAIEKIGCKGSSGGGYRTLNKYVKEFDIDTTHFVKAAASNQRREITDAQMFCEGSRISRRKVKRHYLKLVDYCCKECGNDGVHNGSALVLQLDHINGVNDDNRLENLRLLCPNCHSQSSNYAAKNKKGYDKNSTVRAEYLREAREQWLISQADRIKLFYSLDIDCTKRGWISKVASSLGMKRQKVRDWMIRALPDMPTV